MEPSHTGVCLRGVCEGTTGLWQEAGKYKLKAWKYVRELKLDVQEAEVRQILIGMQGWQRTVRNLDPASGISVF